jgi:hypothetical protein
MRATGLLSRRTLVLCVSVAVLPLMGALSTANAGGKAVAAGVGGTGKVIPLGVGGTGKTGVGGTGKTGVGGTGKTGVGGTG